MERSIIKINLKASGYIAVLAAVLLSVSVIFSVFLLAMEADHHCCNENCPICAVMHICDSILTHFGQGSSAAAFFSFLITQVVYLFYKKPDLVRDTPVLNKIRLNN